MVGTSNNGLDKNSSQFYITTVPCPHLDDQNVIFGKVIKGLDIVKEMSEIPRLNDIPQEVNISFNTIRKIVSVFGCIIVIHDINIF